MCTQSFDRKQRCDFSSRTRGLFRIGVRKQPCNRGLDLRSTRPYASITRQSVANDLACSMIRELATDLALECLDTLSCEKKSRFIDVALRCSINPPRWIIYIYFRDLRRFATIGPGETAFYRSAIERARHLRNEGLALGANEIKRRRWTKMRRPETRAPPRLTPRSCKFRRPTQTRVSNVPWPVSAFPGCREPRSSPCVNPTQFYVQRKTIRF